jgi:RimJ/RimL family protein N-acetyltransferase
MSRGISGSKVEIQPSGRAPESSPLKGALVVLEPFDPDRHCEELYSAPHGDEEAKRVWSYLPDGPFEDAAAFAIWAMRMVADPDRRVYAIRDKHAGRCGGMASYLDIQPSHGCMEMGYIWFAPFFQRTAQATEALFVMLRYAFDSLRYRRMQWRCNALNEKSRAAAERLGFTFEGVFHQHMVVKGCNRDTAWYSIVDHEWPRIRTNFESWLSPSNFDAHGGQILSLSRLNQNA